MVLCRLDLRALSTRDRLQCSAVLSVVSLRSCGERAAVSVTKFRIDCERFLTEFATCLDLRSLSSLVQRSMTSKI